MNFIQVKMDNMLNVRWQLRSYTFGSLEARDSYNWACPSEDMPWYFH